MPVRNVARAEPYDAGGMDAYLQESVFPDFLPPVRIPVADAGERVLLSGMLEPARENQAPVLLRVRTFAKGQRRLRTHPEFSLRQVPFAEATPYRRVFGAAAYDGAISEAIKVCKFNDRPAIASLLADIMVEFAEREMNCEQYDDLVPVPLHRVHQRDRGFNQAQLLAKRLLPAFPRSRLNESLLRIRPTRRQVTIKDSKERRRNVVGAFAVRREEHFDGRTVLLIDDVVTSGGTASECARALKRAGATHVDVFAAALPTSDWNGSLKDRRREEPPAIWSRFVAR